MKHLLLCVFSISLFTACQSESVPLDSNAYVGEYGFVYESVNPYYDKATNHEWDRLTLRPDGHYALVQGGSTKARTKIAGIWRLVKGQPHLILLDSDDGFQRAGLPIRVNNGHIYLAISDDLGQAYVKETVLPDNK